MPVRVHHFHDDSGREHYENVYEEEINDVYEMGEPANPYTHDYVAHLVEEEIEARGFDISKPIVVVVPEYYKDADSGILDSVFDTHDVRYATAGTAPSGVPMHLMVVSQFVLDRSPESAVRDMIAHELAHIQFGEQNGPHDEKNPKFQALLDRFDAPAHAGEGGVPVERIHQEHP